jgi:hypothetical protein
VVPGVGTIGGGIVGAVEGATDGAALGTVVGAAIGGLGTILMNQDSDDTASRPPPGSRPIDQTEWSPNHREIKDAIGAKANDHVRISPDGEVWTQNPNGRWTNHGPAQSYINPGRPGRR